MGARSRAERSWIVQRGLLGIVAMVLAAGVNAQTAVVRVNGAEVSKAEFEAAKKMFAMAAQAQGQTLDPARLDKGAYEQIVGRVLLAQAAREAKVSLEPGTVAKTIEEQKQHAGGPEKFAQGLKEMGLTEKDIERVLAETLLVHRYVDTTVGPKLATTDAEVSKFYEENKERFNHPDQVKIRMVLAEPPKNATEAQRAASKAKAETALKRIKSGEDFAKVASELSDDGTKSLGGNVGWASRDQLLPELKDPIFALAKGSVSEVLTASQGYFVFRIEDKRSAGAAPLDEVQEMIKRSLTSQKVGTKVQSMVQELKGKAKIEVLDPALKASLEAPVRQPEAAR